MENEMVQSLEAEIKAKKLLLKALKHDLKRKEKKLFTETKLGRACLKSVVTVTGPFAHAHQTANAHLESPVMAHFAGLAEDCEELIAEADKVQKEDKYATRTANKCAYLLLELQSFTDQYELPTFCEVDKLVDGLKSNLERLRPPMDPDRFTVLTTNLELAAPSA